jgi:hypothetical protein
VHISGSYFYPSTGVEVYVGGMLLPESGRSGGNGTFTANITIPALPGGPVALGAYDLEGNNATAYMLNILPEIHLSSLSGNSGSAIAITGYGFVPGSGITVLWNGQQMHTSSYVAKNGTFTASMTLPQGIPGTYIISIENSTAAPVVFSLVQYTSFAEIFPAIILPLVTAVGASVYLFRKFRVGRQGR